MIILSSSSTSLQIPPYEQHSQFLQTSSKLRTFRHNQKLRVKISQCSSSTFLLEIEIPMNVPLLQKSNILVCHIDSKYTKLFQVYMENLSLKLSLMKEEVFLCTYEIRTKLSRH